QTRDPALHPSRLDLFEGHAIHARRARVVASEIVGVAKNVLATNLVVEQVEAELGLRLGLVVELPLQAPDLIWRFQAHRQSPFPRPFRKHDRSQGPFLRRNYSASAVMRPCPTPARSTAISSVEAATSDRMGLPRLPVSPFPRAAPNTPADR